MKKLRALTTPFAAAWQLYRFLRGKRGGIYADTPVSRFWALLAVLFYWNDSEVRSGKEGLPV